MAAGAPLWRAQLHAHLDSLDRTLLASKTGWIMSTEGPSTVDIHFSNPVWFFREQGTNADLLGKYPRVTQWLARLESEAAQNKHPDAGKPISPEEARTIAVESGAAGAFLPLDSEWNDANDRQSGDFVGVSSDEFRGLNKPFFCEGELVESTPRGFAVKFTTEAGVEVVHHYPRFGYDVVPIKEE